MACVMTMAININNMAMAAWTLMATVIIPTSNNN